jgi:hypothetical protein
MDLEATGRLMTACVRFLASRQKLPRGVLRSGLKEVER